MERLRGAFALALEDQIAESKARHAEAERLTREYIGRRVEARAVTDR